MGDLGDEASTRQLLEKILSQDTVWHTDANTDRSSAANDIANMAEGNSSGESACISLTGPLLIRQCVSIDGAPNSPDPSLALFLPPSACPSSSSSSVAFRSNSMSHVGLGGRLRTGGGPDSSVGSGELSFKSSSMSHVGLGGRGRGAGGGRGGVGARGTAAGS